MRHSSDLSDDRILARQQAAREQRAQEQGAGYEFVLDGEGYYFNCLCLALSEVYETTRVAARRLRRPPTR